MPNKRKQPSPPPPFLPKGLTRYRNISESSAYIPYIYIQSISDRKKDLIVVDENQSSSAEE
jgi:hypothetical protein